MFIYEVVCDIDNKNEVREYCLDNNIEFMKVDNKLCDFVGSKEDLEELYDIFFNDYEFEIREVRKMRKFLIYVEMNDDLSEYDLVCSIDGKEVRRKEEYCLGDVCIDLEDFEKSICDDFKVDTRFDEFRIKIDMISC